MNILRNEPPAVGSGEQKKPRRTVAVVVVATVVAAGVGVGAFLALKPKVGTASGMDGVDSTSHAPAPSMTIPHVSKYRVYLNRSNDTWEQPFGGVERTTPDKVMRAMLGAASVGMTGDVQMYNSRGVGTKDQMLLAAVGDFDNAEGGRLSETELLKMMANVRESVGLAIEGLTLQPTKDISTGCKR